MENSNIKKGQMWVRKDNPEKMVFVVSVTETQVYYYYLIGTHKNNNDIPKALFLDRYKMFDITETFKI